MTDEDYMDNLALLPVHQPQKNPNYITWSEQRGALSMQIKQNKYVLNKKGVISTLTGKLQQLVNQLAYLGSNISSSKVISTYDMFFIIWKSE